MKENFISESGKIDIYGKGYVPEKMKDALNEFTEKFDESIEYKKNISSWYKPNKKLVKLE
ncbi:MAG: hypothetical protein IH934_04405 [Nanoarchaeota archaeon]|nr:hypothetical protein [Nanoarchaeota archaeon]